MDIQEFTWFMAGHRRDLRVVRAYLQYRAAEGELPTELVNAAGDVIHNKKIFCQPCPNPMLMMMADPTYYSSHKQELAERNYGFRSGNVVLEHGSRLPVIDKFYGIRGVCYTFEAHGVHTNFIDMDDTDYFRHLPDDGKHNLALSFLTNHPVKVDRMDSVRHRYIQHMESMLEVNVAFGGPSSTEFNVMGFYKMI